MATELSASLEDYIEVIYHLVEESDVARVKDIAERLNVRNASVTGALHALADRELVNYAPYDATTLTPQGLRVAEDVVRRHRTLRDFFVNVLSIEETAADEAACRMEHAVPAEVLQSLSDFAHFVEECPRAGEDWIERFKELRGRHIDPAGCGECVQDCMRKLSDQEEI
jgi:DtxR family transcriptional regulator, Mn-dependent transcriptional regulator